MLTKPQVTPRLDRTLLGSGRRNALVAVGLLLVWWVSGRDWTGAVIALALGALVAAYTTQLRRSAQVWADTRSDK
jgi:hypothetical protein